MKFYIGTVFKNKDLVNNVSKKLISKGLHHTYNWASNISTHETIDDMIKSSELEQQAIIDSDIVIILLPAGRGTHIELGIALALNKKIYLCSLDGKDFDVENSVNFYQNPNIIRLVGNIDSIIEKIVK